MRLFAKTFFLLLSAIGTQWVLPTFVHADLSDSNINNVVTEDVWSSIGSLSYDAGSGSDRVLIAILTITFASSNVISDVTYNSSSMTCSSQTDPYTWQTVYLCYHLSPASGSNTFDITSGDDDVVSAIIYYVDGADTSGVGNTGNGNGDSTSASASVTPTAAGSLLIAAVGHNSASVAGDIAGASGTTETAEVALSGLQDTWAGWETAPDTSSQTLGASFGSDGWTIRLLEIKEAAATLEQEGFAFGDDDGSESAHTLDTQDTNVTEEIGTKTLRTIINATGDPASIAYKLKYQKNGSGGYVDVPLVSGTAGGPTNGRVAFVADWDPDIYWVLDSTDLGTSYGDSASGNDDNTAVASGDISTSDDYSGMNSQNDDGQNSDFDIHIVTDAGMLLYIPAGLSHGTNYGLFHNGGGTNAQGAFLRATVTGVELSCTHNAGSSNVESVIEEIPDASLPGWFAFSCQFASYGGSQGDMALWLDGVAERSGTRVYQLAYGSGDPDFGNNGGQEPDASGVLDPPSYSGGDWGGNTAINSTGILIANFAEDNPNGDNTSPDGNGDAWHEDYYADHWSTGSTNEVYISASSNVTAGGESTTARLTAPSGKTTSNFTTGRRWDDENGSDSIDIASGYYTELEWVLTTQSPADTDDYYEFRVYNGDSALDTYSVTPKWTIGAGAAASTIIRQNIFWFD